MCHLHHRRHDHWLSQLLSLPLSLPLFCSSAADAAAIIIFVGAGRDTITCSFPLVCRTAAFKHVGCVRRRGTEVKGLITTLFAMLLTITPVRSPIYHLHT